MKEGESGFSLVELLVALGLLAWATVSAGTLFVVCGSLVQSGLKLTQATALAHGIMEDLEREPCPAIAAIVHGSVPDPGALEIISDTRTAGSAAGARWGPAVRGALPGGYAVLTVTPLGGDAVPVLAAGDAFRVELELGWVELRRERRLREQRVCF